MATIKVTESEMSATIDSGDFDIFEQQFTASKQLWRHCIKINTQKKVYCRLIIAVLLMHL